MKIAAAAVSRYSELDVEAASWGVLGSELKDENEKRNRP
jgi:hypothetical protein